MSWALSRLTKYSALIQNINKLRKKGGRSDGPRAQGCENPTWDLVNRHGPGRYENTTSPIGCRGREGGGDFFLPW